MPDGRNLTLRICPICNRDDRYGPFTGRSHFSGGTKCSGVPEVVQYIPARWFDELAHRLEQAEGALRKARVYAEEIERATQPGDAHQCAKIIQRFARAALREGDAA